MFFDFFLVVCGEVIIVFIYVLRFVHLELVCWLSFFFFSFCSNHLSSFFGDIYNVYGGVEVSISSICLVVRATFFYPRSLFIRYSLVPLVVWEQGSGNKVPW